MERVSIEIEFDAPLWERIQAYARAQQIEPELAVEILVGMALLRESRS